MSFWGTAADGVTGSIEVGSSMEPIPAGTDVCAACEEAKWDTYDGVRFISLKWRVIQGEYEKRVIFQKIHVFDKDTAKADRAKRMLAAIDMNCGGNLIKIQSEPSDMDLMRSLVGRPMMLKLQVWAIDKDANGLPVPAAEQRKGNWVCAVSPRSGAVSQPKPQAQTYDPDDSIPF